MNSTRHVTFVAIITFFVLIPSNISIVYPLIFLLYAATNNVPNDVTILFVLAGRSSVKYFLLSCSTIFYLGMKYLADDGCPSRTANTRQIIVKEKHGRKSIGK